MVCLEFAPVSSLATEPTRSCEKISVPRCEGRPVGSLLDNFGLFLGDRGFWCNPRLFFGSSDIVAVGDDVFVLSHRPVKVVELSVVTSKVVNSIPFPSRDLIVTPTSLSVDGPDVFVSGLTPVKFQSVVAEFNISTHALVAIIRDPYSGAPDASYISTDGPDVFALFHLGAIVEFNTTTGKTVRVLSAPAYDLSEPNFITNNGPDVFVTSQQSNTVTEINAAAGALVRVLSPRHQTNCPCTVALRRQDAFVTNEVGTNRKTQDGSVTEFNITTGTLVRVLDAKTYGFHIPKGISIFGSDAFVTNDQGTVTEFNTTTGALVRILQDKEEDIWGQVVARGNHVFYILTVPIKDSSVREVSEFSATTGQLIRKLDAPSYEFNDTRGAAVAGSDVFVINRNSLTEFSAITTSLVHVFR